MADCACRASGSTREKWTSLDVLSIDPAQFADVFPLAVLQPLILKKEELSQQEALDLTDVIVELPMWGVNKSLNVMVSLGIVLYEVMEKATKL